MNIKHDIKMNRFWQECQRFDRAQNDHEINKISSPQVGGATE